MRLVTWLLVNLLVSSTCLAQRPTRAEKLEGMEAIRSSDPEIYDHFTGLLEQGFKEAEAGIEVDDQDYEKFVIFEADGELYIYLIVRDEEGQFSTAIQFAVLPEEADQEVELATRLLESDSSAMMRSNRLGQLHKAERQGTDLKAIALEQTATQDEVNDTLSTLSPRPVIAVSCAGGGDSVCCGFSGGGKVRVICVCHQGSGKWVLCFDSKWL